ncbi:hypothetical protein CCS01_09625 [Rhodopila globiformis]|uniref:Calpain catalytic domain-containing protein n=2 Tax=Rhodopila globiformis TaxID=1071 RepID=A0A2S6NJ85_RHOGL|nr:hypothetical protein CCS01_09625 [Rhodopila globiformis]
MVMTSNLADTHDDTGLDGAGVASADPIGLLAAAAMAKAAAQAGPITDVPYLLESGDASAISVHDINQGGIGDCYLLSSIGEIAMQKPSFISGMIRQLSGTTEAVTFYKDARTGGNVTASTTAFMPVSVTVDNSKFLPGGVDGDQSCNPCTQGGQHEIWAQVLEEGYANLIGGSSDITANYGAIGNGGWPWLAMESLTGQQAQFTLPDQMPLATLVGDVAAGDLMVFDTASSNLGYGLVGNHAYMFDHVDRATGDVYLDNPWGFDQPSGIPFSQLASAGIVEIGIGHVGAAATAHA